MSRYRALTKTEIDKLKSSSCTAGNWDRIKVKDGFNAETVKNVEFGGDVRLGRYEKPISFIAGFEGKCGISNSTIYNCTIGDDVYINNVHTLANYRVGNDCVIANVTYLAVQGQSCFGNGTEVSVINEAGGREIKIYDKLSSQIGYIMASYRHNKKLISALNNAIDNYCLTVKSDIGQIGSGTKIMNCGTLKNIKIGEMTIIEGVNRLENGSINSTVKANVRIGANVIAKDFIISSGAKVIDNTILDKVFIGQGTLLSKGFSVENCVFFANCGGFHGEAASVFAGPFTVSHHKATLLIAGMFSFFNAGSASNQSNHMYKLGPVHQAVFERGCKMGSGAYVLYPVRLGLFNVILGKHDSHPDTRDLPFSYILQGDSGTLIVPGYNFQSSGTLRDIRKWPARDNRFDDEKLDNITFEAMTPYSAWRMLNGIEILNRLLAQSRDSDEWVSFQNASIKRRWAEKGIEYYRLALNDYFGTEYVKRKIAGQLTDGISDDSLSSLALGKWADIGGMIAPLAVIENICKDIETGSLLDVQAISDRLKSIYDNYQYYQWSWIHDKIKDISERQILSDWKEAFERIGEMITDDAAKEFNEVAKISYGIDGDSDQADSDFKAVMGKLEDSSFAEKLRLEIEEKRSLAAKLGI